jgi:hypothetical protein
VLGSSFALAELPSAPGLQAFLRVGSLSGEEASAALDAALGSLPREVASGEAVAAVKARVLPLTTLAEPIGTLAEELRGSTSEANLRTRAEAWAARFEQAARRQVAATLDLEDVVRNGLAFSMADLVREIVAAGGPVQLPHAKYKVPVRPFACRLRESDEAGAALAVDLVARTVDFASGAHRAAAVAAVAEAARAAAEAEVARGWWAWQ